MRSFRPKIDSIRRTAFAKTHWRHKSIRPMTYNMMNIPFEMLFELALDSTCAVTVFPCLLPFFQAQRTTNTLRANRLSLGELLSGKPTFRRNDLIPSGDGWCILSAGNSLLSEQQTMKHWGKKDGCPQSAQHFVVWQFDGVTTTIIREQSKCEFLLCTHLLLGELSFFSSCSIRHNGCLSFLQSRYENIHYTVHMRVCIYYNACLLCWR